MPLAGLARRLWQKGEEPSGGRDTLAPQASMTGGQEEGVEVKADVPRTEARIEELEKQLAITRQELNQWRDISGQHMVKHLLDQLAERDREVVRLRSELEIAVGGPVDSGVPPAVLLEWSQSGPQNEAKPSSLLQRKVPPESGGTGQSMELPSASERIGESGELQPQSSECTGSPASSERTLGPSGCQELPLPTKGNGANPGVSNHQAHRAGASNAQSGHPYSAQDAIDRDDVELRREGLEQWIEGTSDPPTHRSSERVPAVPVRPPPVSQAWGGTWGDERSTRSIGDVISIISDDNQNISRRAPGTTDAGGADDGAGAGNDGHHGNVRRDITPRDLALRRDAVEQLQEEIHDEIAKHREAYQFEGVAAKHIAGSQPEVAGADVEPEECGRLQMMQHGVLAQPSVRSVNSSELNLSSRTMSDPGSVRASYGTMPMPLSAHCGPHGNMQAMLSTASETSTVLPADGGFEAATEASSEMASTAISGERRSPRGSPKGDTTFDDSSELLPHTYEDHRASMHGRTLEGSGGGDGDEVQRQPTGGSLVSCSFFVSAEDDDGRKEMRRRRFERNQFERRSRRDRASSNSSITDQKRGVGMEKQSDTDHGGSASYPGVRTGSASNLSHLPLAHMPKTAPEEERPSPSRAGANSNSRGAHSRLHTERSRSPGQNSRHEPPEGGHRFGPPMRVAAANAAAYAAAAAASALAAVSAVKQEQRAGQPSQRHRLPGSGVLSATMPSAAAHPAGATPPHAAAARNRSSPRASPRPSPRPSRTSPLNSPRVSTEEGARRRAFELNQGRPQSEAPPSRSAGQAALASATSPTNMTALRTKFTELRDEMKRRRSKEIGDLAEQELEESPSRRSAAPPAEPRPEPIAGEGATATVGGSFSSSPGSVDRGRPVTAGATSERNAQSPGATQEQLRKHTLQQVPEQSRASHLQPILSRGGGNNSRSPRPGGGSGLHTRGRARAHTRDEGLGGGPGSFTGPASPSASSNAPGGSSGQHSGLSRCSSARRRIGAGTNPGRRAVPPISGLLNLRSSAHSGSGGSHNVAPGSVSNSGDPERSAPPEKTGTPAGAVPDRSGSLKAPLPGATALAAAAVAAAAAAGIVKPEASAAEKVPEQKCDSFESIASRPGSALLPTSNSTGVLPTAPCTVTGAAAGNGSMATLSTGGGGSLQVGISGTAAQILRSARHRQQSPVGSQSQKLAGDRSPGVLVPHSPTVVATPVAPVGSATIAHISTGGSSSSASAAKGPASPRDHGESESDPVQEAVLQFTQHCGRQPLVRLSPGVYLHGQKKLQLTLKQGRLMVRIGGGLVNLSETLLNSPALGGSGSSGIAIAGLGSSGGSTVVQATPVGQVSTTFSATSGFVTPGGTTTMSTPVATAVVAATGLQAMPHSSRQANAFHSLRETSTGPLPVRVVNSSLRLAH